MKVLIWKLLYALKAYTAVWKNLPIYLHHSWWRIFKTQIWQEGLNFAQNATPPPNLHITALFLDHDISLKQMFHLQWIAFSATIM